MIPWAVLYCSFFKVLHSADSSKRSSLRPFNMKSLLLILGLVYLLDLARARVANSKNLGQAPERLDKLQERNYGPLADPGRGCSVTKWRTSTKEITLTKTKTKTMSVPPLPPCYGPTGINLLTDTKYRSMTQNVTKTTTFQVPTTIWRFSTTTTLMRAPTATVSSPTTVTETKTRTEREVETVFET